MSLRDLAIPLRTLDPDSDISDLAPLREIVGDARVVSIGESAHNIREFYQLKDRIFRYLVAECGFTAFVMESGFAEALAVNEWILGGEGNVRRIADDGITFLFGKCEEMRSQLQWMRSWNDTHQRKVRFYGMDVPSSGTNPGPAVAASLARLTPRPQDAELLKLATLPGKRAEAFARYVSMPAHDRERLSQGIAELVERANVADNAVAYPCARSAQCVDEVLRNGWKPFVGRSPRDELMAENVRWILEREERIVIGAHNAHIQRGSLLPSPMLGTLLSPKLGKDMVVIGTTYASGEVMKISKVGPGRSYTEMKLSLKELPPPPPHTIDALMDSIDLPLHIVDLRRVQLDQLRGITAILGEHDPLNIVPNEAFDALVHVRHVTQVAGAFDTLRADFASESSPN